jgi:hypothetical protein
MNSENAHQELAARLTSVIEDYLGEVRRAAEDAVVRALSGASTVPMRSRPEPRSAKGAASSRRRTQRELAGLREQLETLVRSEPGEAMATFAAKLGVSVRLLHRPMALLRRAGRVRTVGERHQTRYFPVAGRASSAA